MTLPRGLAPRGFFALHRCGAKSDWALWDNARMPATTSQPPQGDDLNPAKRARPGVRMKRTVFYLYLLISMVLSLLSAWVVYTVSWQEQLQQRQQESVRRVARNAGFLQHEVDKFGLLPLAASYNDTLREALDHPDDARLLAQANDYLSG
jgi:two-component system C4-dicarboxylate transport sensor histidine kinase DctB